MSDTRNKLSRFWQELKRRNVLRSLTIYAGTAFVILEASDIIFPRLGFPDWSVNIVLYLLIMGAAVTLAVSWIFDLTPGGIEKTKSLDEIPAGEKGVVSSGWKVTTYISLAVIAALIIYNLTGVIRNARAGSIQSIVVLPFDNFTGDDHLEYFISGMHSSFIGDLGKISGLRVISKTSSSLYQNMDKSVPEIASELMVDAVVETNVTCVGEKVCVQFKLISAFPEENMIWSGNYDSEMGNILNLYNRVIRDLADEIQLPLSKKQLTVLDQPRPVDPDAYEAYLKGKFNMEFLTRESQQAAMDYFKEAIRIDPGYAQAYAGLAGVWAFLKQMDYVTPDEANPKLEEYMSKALRIDSLSAEIFYYNGIKKVWSDFDYEGGERSFKRCLDINPNYSLARAYYSHLLMLLKRPDEMREQMKLAFESDPMNPLIHVLATVELLIESRYDECIIKAKQLQSKMPNNPLLMLVLFQCHAEKGNDEKAIIELKKVFGQLADDAVIATLEQEYMNAGFQHALVAAADRWSERFPGASAQHLTMLYAYGGNVEKMLFWLERAYIRKDPSNPYLGVVVYLRPYHNEPRYTEIIRRLNLTAGAFQSN